MKRKDIEKIGKQILNLEKQYQTNPDSQIADEMEKIVLSLTFEEILEIDEYIQEKLLTK